MTLYRLKIERDVDAYNPRTEHDNVGTMVCWHGRYTLGDEQPDQSPTQYKYQLALDVAAERRAADDPGDASDSQWLYEDIDELEDAEYAAAVERAQALLNAHYVVLPLHLYDHSGITMSTSRFSCPWDSGQVGFIYVAKDKALEEWGHAHEPQKMTDEEFWAERLTYEVKEYDLYLTGECYGYVLEKGIEVKKTYPNGRVEREVEWEHVDSCWGFMTDDMNELRAMVSDGLPDGARPLLEQMDWTSVGEWIYADETTEEAA
ncbi:MAG TPA: hypothetical protein PK177_09460 [Burkholderiaceae bacterium]|nr:hypothetical protein [Burkholderiaceae bacterium]